MRNVTSKPILKSCQLIEVLQETDFFHFWQSLNNNGKCDDPTFDDFFAFLSIAIYFYYILYYIIGTVMCVRIYFNRQFVKKHTQVFIERDFGFDFISLQHQDSIPHPHYSTIGSIVFKFTTKNWISIFSKKMFES